MIQIKRMEWQKQAACSGADPELFFSDDRDKVKAAKAVCVTCPVRVACYDHAIQHGEWDWGIWGGATPNERRVANKKGRRKGPPVPEEKICPECSRVFTATRPTFQLYCSQNCAKAASAYRRRANHTT